MISFQMAASPIYLFTLSETDMVGSQWWHARINLQLGKYDPHLSPEKLALHSQERVNYTMGRKGSVVFVTLGWT